MIKRDARCICRDENRVISKIGFVEVGSINKDIQMIDAKIVAEQIYEKTHMYSINGHGVVNVVIGKNGSFVLEENDNNLNEDHIQGNGARLSDLPCCKDC